ncbi:MAG: hypothetical protein ACLQVJ_00490 [Syntrophobacteraceae bacterium]
MAKKKINDDTLLQLIRDGNSPADAARRLGVGRAAVSNRLKAEVWGRTPLPTTSLGSTPLPICR